MKAMLEDPEGWGLLSLNTDVEELEVMRGYWEAKYYIEVPDELVKEYEEAWDALRTVETKLVTLARRQGKTICP